MATNFKSNKPKSAKPEPAPVAKPVAKPAVVVAKPAVVAAKPAAKASASYQPTQEEIGVRAFEIYVSEGCQEGNELEHWLRAEKELRSQNRK